MCDVFPTHAIHVAMSSPVIHRACALRKNCCGNIIPQNVSWVRKRLGNNVSLSGDSRNISLETNELLRMLKLGNTARATTESSQLCFLGAPTGKHLVSETNRKHLLLARKRNSVSATNVPFSRKRKMQPRFFFR